MTTEEKQLLFKDLSARLPYECMLKVEGDWFDDEEREAYDCKLTPYSFMDLVVNHDCDVKPYLRPMSSMTEEEQRHFFAFSTTVKSATSITSIKEHFDTFNSVKYSENLIDWLQAHHFDYRGLIEKGLALEAPADMYKNE